MERSEVKQQYKWKTEDIFDSDERWEEQYESTMNKISFSQFSGKLSDGDSLLSLLKLKDEIMKSAELLAVYALLKHDEDSRVSKYAAYDAKVDMLFTKFSTELAFFEPEMARQDDKYLDSLMADGRFSDYDYYLKRIKDGKAHVLSGDQQKIVSMLGETFSTFRETFSMIDNVDFPFPEIEWEGGTVKLTHGLYGLIMHSDNREKRREAYEKYYAAYVSLINTITSTYYGNVKKDVFLSKAYKYPSSLDMALFEEDVDKSVYDNLLESVGANLSAMHRYIADRKKILGYDKLYFYDVYAPLVGGVNFNLPYDEAYDYVIKGLAPLGKEYQSLLRKAYDERWLDVEETDGKRSGAFSAACYGVHPFVLLNYKPSISEVFTIAHEMGHSLHTYFSQKNQPFAKSEYKIFVAEVASTVNEVLLLKFMLNDAKDENLRKYLLNYYLDSIRATLHRQSMFAEFEYEAHFLAERGEPLTKETLCNVYAEIGKKYYGGEIEHDYNISCEWARIPHFYSAFYVYKYSTGIISAINIALRILSEGESAVKDYFTFLSGGGSTDPVSLLKMAGVDLTQKKPFEVAMREFEDTLILFEKSMGL